MVGDALQHLVQIGVRIEAIELGRADQAVNRGGPLTAGIGAGEQVVLASLSMIALMEPPMFALMAGRRGTVSAFQTG